MCVSVINDYFVTDCKEEMWWLLLISTVIHYNFVTIKGETTGTNNNTYKRYDSENVTRRLRWTEVIPQMPVSAPPLWPYFCKQLRPFTDRITIWRKGSSPYQVDAMWLTDRVVLMTVFGSVQFGSYIQFALQVRLHDTRPIGRFEKDVEAVISDCPPGRANTLYLYNTKLRRVHRLRWFPPKWFKNHTAKLFYTVTNHELRYWKGNITLPPRVDLLRLKEERIKEAEHRVYLYYKAKVDLLKASFESSKYSTSSRKPRTKLQRRKEKKKTMNNNVQEQL